jgi:hypothetical protein
MPQFKGYAKPGSIADKLPKNNDGEVDTESQFKVLLKRNGVAVSEPQEVPADQLKATQTELVGAKVAGMTKALETEPNHPKITAPIYVSNDGYVLDGHHRWAAVTSSAVASGKPAMMNVRVIDMPIKDLVKISNDFADQIGIQQKKADANAEAPKSDLGVDSVVYNKRTKTVGIVRLGDERGETKTDADGNVNTDELEPYNPMKYPHQKDAQVAPSTSKEIDSRGLWKPFSQKKEVTEVSTNDWHYKAIMSLWDKGGSFTRKKLGTIICRDPKANRRDIEDELRNSGYDEVTDVTDRLRIEGIIKENEDASNIIKDLDKVRHDLIKKVDVLITKKKKLYANVDITTPMSADEKQLDKDIQSIFSQIQGIIQQKRKIKNENVIKENEDTVADESRMARSGIKTAIESANNIQQIFTSKGEEFDVPAWVQSYLALASDYLHSINEYYNGIENK